MIKKYLALLMVIFAIPFFSSSAFAYTGSNWMGAIDGSKSLAALTIPGTHDSGANYEPFPGTAKCQNLTIEQQLSAGVRFLDIRCRHINDAFTIHHGSVYQNMNFTDVLTAVYAFLDSNPTETVMMCVKEEHTTSGCTRTYEQTFDSYVALNPTKWYTGDTLPTLGSVRGKIVLFRRFAAANTPKGINVSSGWLDNTTFTIDNGSTTIKVQDQYVVPNNANKWTAITNLYTEAKNQNSSWLYINFTSGYKSGIFGIPSITTVSNYMNPNLVTYFTSAPAGRYGITLMDFADTNKCSLIYGKNF